MIKLFVFLSGLGLLMAPARCKDTSPWPSQNQLEYRAVNRGYYLQWLLQNQTLTYTKGSSPKAESKSLTLTAAQWDKVQQMVQGIDWSQLPQWPAPSTKHQYDGAAGAQLQVHGESLELSSVTFDHHNAPNAIKPLVDYIESLIP